MTRDELTALFTNLGAAHPRQWADSQIDEGIPQLHRFVFLRQAWQAVLDPGNRHWLGNLERGGGTVAEAIVRLQAAGASHADLATLVRSMQQDLLFSLCQQLDASGGIEPDVEGVSWGLFTTDENGSPLEPLTMLHESVMETDPFSESHAIR